MHSRIRSLSVSVPVALELGHVSWYQKISELFHSLDKLGSTVSRWAFSLGSYELQSEGQVRSHEIEVTDFVAFVVYLILGFTNMDFGEGCTGDP